MRRLHQPHLRGGCTRESKRGERTRECLPKTRSRSGKRRRAHVSSRDRAPPRALLEKSHATKQHALVSLQAPRTFGIARGGGGGPKKARTFLVPNKSSRSAGRACPNLVFARRDDAARFRRARGWEEDGRPRTRPRLPPTTGSTLGTVSRPESLRESGFVERLGRRAMTIERARTYARGFVAFHRTQIDRDQIGDCGNDQTRIDTGRRSRADEPDVTESELSETPRPAPSDESNASIDSSSSSCREEEAEAHILLLFDQTPPQKSHSSLLMRIFLG